MKDEDEDEEICGCGCGSGCERIGGRGNGGKQER